MSNVGSIRPKSSRSLVTMAAPWWRASATAAQRIADAWLGGVCLGPGPQTTNLGWSGRAPPPRPRPVSEANQVPKEGLEPSRPFGRRILSPLRLPFRHFGSSGCSCRKSLRNIPFARWAMHGKLENKSLT